MTMNHLDIYSCTHLRQMEEGRSQTQEAQESRIRRFGRWVVQNPRKVITAAVATAVLAGSGVSLVSVFFAGSGAAVALASRSVRALPSHYQELAATSVQASSISVTSLNSIPVDVLQQAPSWSFIAVDFCSVCACISAATAPIVQLIKDWKNYLQSGAIPNTQSNSWLIIDFAGRSFILSMLLIQYLVQDIELTAFNFLTPGAAIAIELVVVGSTLYFRHRQHAAYITLDDA